MLMLGKIINILAEQPNETKTLLIFINPKKKLFLKDAMPLSKKR